MNYQEQRTWITKFNILIIAAGIDTSLEVFNFSLWRSYFKDDYTRSQIKCFGYPNKSKILCFINLKPIILLIESLFVKKYMILEINFIEKDLSIHIWRCFCSYVGATLLVVKSRYVYLSVKPHSIGHREIWNFMFSKLVPLIFV